jgi:hypothetical protein
MNIYLINQACRETVGLRELLQEACHVLVSRPENAELTLAVFDYDPKQRVRKFSRRACVRRAIVRHSIKDRPLFVYVPRGTVVMRSIALSVNRHQRRFGHKAVQRVYTYDQLSNIVSWVSRTGFDLSKQRQGLVRVISNRKVALKVA